MARQETKSTHAQEDAHPSASSDRSQADGNKPRTSAGMTEVRTSDPNIVAPEPTSPPDRAVTLQTSQLSGDAPAYPFGCAGGVEQRPEKANGKKRDRHEDEQGGRDEDKKHEHKKHDEDHRHDDDRHHEDRHPGHRHKKKKKEGVVAKLPGWQALLVTGVLALACGAGGAWAYSALSGAAQTGHQSKGGKGEKGGKSGGEKSGEPDSEQESNALEKQVEQVSDNLDQLGTRIDRLNQAMQEARQPVPQYYPGTSRIERMAPAGDEAPLVPHALQTQLTVLQRKVDQMADLSGRVGDLERRVIELQEAIKLLAETRTSN